MLDAIKHFEKMRDDAMAMHTHGIMQEMKRSNTVQACRWAIVQLHAAMRGEEREPHEPATIDHASYSFDTTPGDRQ
ncbi:MAG: hypothetical protein WCE58_02230 [Gallionella sp.]